MTRTDEYVTVLRQVYSCAREKDGPGTESWNREGFSKEVSLDLEPEGNASEIWAERKEVRMCVHCLGNSMTQIQEAGTSLFGEIRNMDWPAWIKDSDKGEK